MIKIKTIIKSVTALATFAISLSLCISGVSAANFLEAEGFDTIAGYTTLLKASGAEPFDSLVFTVSKPGNETLLIPVYANEKGTAQADFYDFHTKKSGEYKIAVKTSDDKYSSEESTFMVYPDDVSVVRSTVNSDRLTASANGSDKVLVTINLMDKHGNAIPNHLMSLVSSRNSDQVIRISKQSFTDNLGDISFVVSSSDLGVSTYSAIDLTSGYTLNQRVKIAYLNGNNYSTGIGGNLYTSVLYAQAPEAGPVHHLKIEDISSQVPINQSLSFKVTAYDSNSIKVPNYAGTVRFTVTDTHASLPPDYNFKESDAGSHTFSLGLRFVTAGTHKLGVIDTDNTDIKGEISLSAGVSTTPTPSSGTPPAGSTATPATTVPPSSGSGAERVKPVIITPTAGKYPRKNVLVTGTAGTGDQLKIYDNNTDVGSFSADGSGKFSHQLNNLSDGKHTVRIGVTDGTGTIYKYSDDLVIEIDSNLPPMDEIAIFPNSTALKSANVLIKVYSEKNLDQAVVITNNKIYELTPSLSEPGAYTVSIKTPDEIGDYPVDVVLIDQLGNEGNYKNATILKIVSEGGFTTGSGTTPTPGPVVSATPLPTPKPGDPSRVENLLAWYSDSRITLHWDPATDNTFVQKYRVFYGIEEDNLIVAVNTFDASTRWYIPNLTNGQEYYFAVAAIDSEGNTGQRSETIKSTPVSGAAHPTDEQIAAQRATIGAATPTPAPGATPTPTVTPVPTPTSTPTGVAAGAIAGGVTPTPVPTPVATATPLPLPERTAETGPTAWVVVIISITFSAFLTWFFAIKRSPRFVRNVNRISSRMEKRRFYNLKSSN